MVRIIGWVLSAGAALSLLYAGYVVPLSHFGTMSVENTDPEALVASFNRSLGLVVIVVGILYVVGLVLARRSASVAAAESDGADHAGSALRLPGVVIGAVLLLVAGGALAAFAGLVRDAPTAVLVVPLAWSAALTLFVATSLWGTIPRNLGLTLVCAGLLLVGFVIFLAGTLFEYERFTIVQRFLGDVAIAKGALSLGFVSWAISTLPLVATALIVVGLPLLILPRRPTVGASRWAIVVGLLLMVSSAMIPRVMATAALLSPAEPPEPAPLVDFSAIPPPPPPPPPPDR